MNFSAGHPEIKDIKHGELYMNYWDNVDKNSFWLFIDSWVI